MIQFLKIWANQIIVAIIIATILEMLLPNGNNKKYIKMVIGLYVLFAIIQPIFSKITGNCIEEVEKFNYQKYFKNSSIETASDFEQDNTKLIKKAYIENIEKDITTKMEKRGYEVISCNIQILEEEENYGKLKMISLNLKKIMKQEEKTNKKTLIENVHIQIANESIQTNQTERQKQDI